MGIVDLFSKRKNREKGKVLDVFSSGPLPLNFRIQVIHIWLDVLGEYNQNWEIYDFIHRILLKEYGLPTLTNGLASLGSKFNDLIAWFQETEDEDALNLIVTLPRKSGDMRTENSLKIKEKGNLNHVSSNLYQGIQA